jgi:hypothetical protein
MYGPGSLLWQKRQVVNVPPVRDRRLLRRFPRWPRPGRKCFVPQVEDKLCRVGVPVQFGATRARMPPF